MGAQKALSARGIQPSEPGNHDYAPHLCLLFKVNNQFTPKSSQIGRLEIHAFV